MSIVPGVVQFPLTVVAQAITVTSAEYPSTSFRLESLPLGGPIEALDNKRCTLAILVGEDFRNPRVALKAIGSIRLIAVVQADHPLAKLGEKMSLGLPDLACHQQIVLIDPTPLSAGSLIRRPFALYLPR